MRLVTLIMICGAIFLAGCASQNSSIPMKGDINQMYEGTWESYPTGKTGLIYKIIFLSDYRCHISLISKGKIIYDNDDNCSYRLSHASAIVTDIDYPKKSDSNWRTSVDTTQITPIDNGRLLDCRLLLTTITYKNGKQKTIKAWRPYGEQTEADKTPGGGHFTLHRMTSLKDVFSRLLSKI